MVRDCRREGKIPLHAARFTPAVQAGRTSLWPAVRTKIIRKIPGQGKQTARSSRPRTQGTMKAGLS